MEREEDSQDFKNIDFIDPDTGFQWNKEQPFSHELLVMRAYQTAQTNMAKEMIEGFWESKVDKFGNSRSFYNPDTRMQVIESITTLKNTMIADIKDSDYEKKINNLLESIDRLFKIYNNLQEKWWKEKNRAQQSEYLNLNKRFNPNSLDENSPFYQTYVLDKVKIYREIFEQLELCLALNLKYFKKGKVTG